MSTRCATRRVATATLSALLLVGAASEALAQSDDPCLEVLADRPAELERYDALVGEVLDAQAVADHARALDALEALGGVCDANLRRPVLHAEALAALGRCEEAAAELQDVVGRAGSWPWPGNADDARQRATTALADLRDRCLAQVQINCATAGASIQIDERPAQSCPVELELPSGTHRVVVTKSGMAPLTRDFTLRPGNNFIELDALDPLERPGTVTFDCPTPGTEIQLGSERFGCPAVRELEAGTRSFTAIRPGAQPWSAEVLVREGESVTVFVPDAAAPEAEAQLILTCSPDGATVIIESPALVAPLAQTCPLDLGLPPGLVTLRTSASGFEEDVRTVALDATQPARVEVALMPESPIDIVLRLVAGAAMSRRDDALLDPSVPEEEQDTAAIGGALRLDALVAFAISAESQIAAGVAGRLGFSSTGIYGGAMVDYLYTLDEVVVFFLGAMGGYGTLGIDLCEVDVGRCPGGSAEEEPAGFLGGAHLGVGVLVGSGLGLVIDFGLLGGEYFVVDFAAGVQFAF